MIREYFLTNNIFYITQLKINKKCLILKLKSYIKVPKYYYIYLLKYLYNIVPFSVNIKIYNRYYKIIILKYII